MSSITITATEGTLSAEDAAALAVELAEIYDDKSLTFTVVEDES